MADSEHIIINYSPFGKGVDLESTPTFIGDGFISKARNVEVVRGVVRQRKGYGIRSYNSSSAPALSSRIPINESIIGVAKFWPPGGVTTEVVFTTKNAYTYDYGNGTFTSLFTAIATTTDATWVKATGVMTKTGAFASVTVGDTVIITSGTNMTPGLYTITNKTDDTITISTSAGTANSTAADIVCSVSPTCFTGTATSVSWTIAPIGKGAGAPNTPVLVYTDGVPFGETHSVYQFTGSVAAIATSRLDLSLITSFSFAKQVVWYGEHFMIGDYDTQGDRVRSGVAWGDFQELSIATEVDDMAEYIVADAKGYMQKMIRLGGHLALYFTESIVICDPTTTDDIYLFDVRIQGNGALCPNAIVDIGGYHIFIGQDNVYLYDGGLQLKPIGDNIRRELFSLLDANTTDQVIGQHLPLKNLVQFHLPNRKFFAYNYRDDTWVGPSETAHQITAVGTGVRTVAYHCNDEPFASTYCADTNEDSVNDAPYALDPCSNFMYTAGFELPTIAAGTYYFDYSDIHYLDYTTVITSEFKTDSKAIGDPYTSWGRVMEVRVESRGARFTISYSTDHGDTWTSVRHFFGGSKNFAIEVIPLNFVAQFVMWRILFSTRAAAEVRVLSVRARPSSPRGLP